MLNVSKIVTKALDAGIVEINMPLLIQETTEVISNSLCSQMLNSRQQIFSDAVAGDRVIVVEHKYGKKTFSMKKISRTTGLALVLEDGTKFSKFGNCGIVSNKSLSYVLPTNHKVDGHEYTDVVINMIVESVRETLRVNLTTSINNMSLDDLCKLEECVKELQ